VSYAYEAGLLQQGSEKAKPLEDQLAICRGEMNKGIHVSIPQCEDVLNTLLRITQDEYIPNKSTNKKRCGWMCQHVRCSITRYLSLLWNVMASRFNRCHSLSQGTPHDFVVNNSARTSSEPSTSTPPRKSPAGQNVQAV
jgi:hypothetical protein